MTLIERSACPACDGADFRTLCELPYGNGPVADYLLRKYPHAAPQFSVLDNAVYVIVECQHCGLLFQRDIPDEAFSRTLYEEWVEDPVDGFAVSRRNHGVPYFVKHADQIVDIIRFLGRNPYELQVLDFAFGWGHWCRLVKGFGCKVYGTESSEKRTAAGRASGIIIIDPAEISSYRFDWINANQVFEHLPEPLRTLRGLSAALSADGIVTLGVPGATDLPGKITRQEWRSVFDPLAPLEHLNYFPRGCLARMAALARLRQAAVPERFIWRPDRTSLKQNAKAVLRLTGAPVSNHLFHVFRQHAA